MWKDCARGGIVPQKSYNCNNRASTSRVLNTGIVASRLSGVLYPNGKGIATGGFTIATSVLKNLRWGETGGLSAWAGDSGFELLFFVVTGTIVGPRDRPQRPTPFLCRDREDCWPEGKTTPFTDRQTRVGPSSCPAIISRYSTRRAVWRPLRCRGK